MKPLAWLVAFACAALCGIAGLKATWGRIPETGVPALCWNVGHVGPMGLTVDDVAATLGDADVHEDRAIALAIEQDVGRLDVAVDQAAPGHVGQRHRTLEADLHDLVQRQQVDRHRHRPRAPLA